MMNSLACTFNFPLLSSNLKPSKKDEYKSKTMYYFFQYFPKF